MSARAVSASQIETYSGCKRKWGHRYIDKVEIPPNKSASDGSMIHSQFERYLKGESLDYSTPAARLAAERAMPGIANLPPPGTPGMLVEHAFNLETSKGLVFRGFVDLVVPDSATIPNASPLYVGDGCREYAGVVPCIVDHKSTSSFRWAKSTDVLMTDVQAMIYAYWAMSHFKVPVVELLWNYVATKGAASTTRRHLRVLQSHVVEQFLGPITAVATELCVTYAAKPRVLDLPPSLEQCDAYGGCPYKGLCVDLHSGPLGHITPDEVSEPFPVTKGTPMSIDLFSRLESVKAQEDAAPMPAGITNAPPGYVPAPFLVGTAASTPAIFPPPLQLTPSTAVPPGVVVAINPPEWQPPPTPEQRAAAAVVETPAEPAKRKRRTKAEMAADAAKEVEGSTPSDVSTVAGGSTRAGERGVDPADSRTSKPEERPLFAPEIITYDATDTIPAPAPAMNSFTLFLDCAPERTPVLHGSDLYGKVNEELQKTFGADFRRIKFEGPGLFVAGFLKLFDESPRDIVIDTRTAEGLLVVDSLRARAGLVVR